jgi:signal transduction histidine kinase
MPTPVKILLVDDQPRNLDALEAILDAPEYQLVRAESADAALLELLAGDFAAIVLDIKMPGMSGPELAQVIKRREKSRHIPILFLTAHLQDEEDVLLAYGAGGVDYLSKPVNPQVLRSKITVFAELFRKTRALAAANLALEAEIAERHKAQEALRRANEDLEARVQERTADLTRINQSLQNAKAEAEAANEAKDHFLAVLSHELRTPLMPVLVTVQLLEGDMSLSEEARDALATARRNVELEARLIDDLLDLTRVARGKLQLNLQDVDLNIVVRQAVEICSVDAADKGIKLILEAMAVGSRTMGDPARLQQVFWNLIKNAVKFTPPGGEIHVRCHNELTEGREHAVVSVTDTGVGIEPGVLARVFDAFEQGSRSIARQFGGLGLGLAISKALVDLHSGSIHAHSQGRGHGATFSVRLPVADRPQRPAAPPLNRDPLRLREDPNAPHLHVLLVEDHLDSARVLVRLLRAIGYTVTHAKDVSSALQSAAEGFDLLISDLGLPDGSGHDLMRQLCASGPVHGIALSGYGMDVDVARSREAGFKEHLTKPVNIEQLQAAIERVAPAVSRNAASPTTPPS